MVLCAIHETFSRVISQPGSTGKNWDKAELVRCRATGTGITTELDLKGRAHPVFANWTGVEPELRRELEQPILLASRLVKAAGLPWLSDFLIDDIFDEKYPGCRAQGNGRSASAYPEATIPHSIARHHQGGAQIPRERRARWKRAAQDMLRHELPKLMQWQLDADMFSQKGWSGKTCRHRRGDNLPLDELNSYETIRKAGGDGNGDGSRALTTLLNFEYPTRMAELRRLGRERDEEYLLTAFMTAVMLLHELGHAIYWKDPRSLTSGLREPFYGGDLEMELGDSFVATIFGGWIPVPVRERSRLQNEFTLVDGLAWRQALNWDCHRMRPKYRAHYSISVDYIARLFSEVSWSKARGKERALIRPRSLAGNGIALRMVGLYTALTEANQYATAAIADFHYEGYGWTWNRQPGAWFRIPQYDGCLYLDLELPVAGENAVREPVARGGRDAAVTERGELDMEESQSIEAGVAKAMTLVLQNLQRAKENTKEPSKLLPPLPSPAASSSLSKATMSAIMTAVTTKPNLTTTAMRMNGEDGRPRKFALLVSSSSSSTKIPQAVIQADGSQPDPKGDMGGASSPRKWDKDKEEAPPPSRSATAVPSSPLPLPSTSPPSPPPSLSSSPSQAQGQGGPVTVFVSSRPMQQQRANLHEEGAEGRLGRVYEEVPCGRLGGSRDGEDEDEDDEEDHAHDYSHNRDHNNSSSGSAGDSGEISVDELKKRLSQLIDISLTELEGLFDTKCLQRASTW